MHTAFHILEFWALAFISLGATLALLNIFWDLIGQDLCLKTLGQEAVIVGIASLIEAISLWLIIKYAHAVPPNVIVCLLIVPGFVVGLIYKFSHLEDWSHYEIICLLMFQLVVALVGASLLTAHFGMAIAVAIIFAVILGVIASFMRGL
jgi:hypothetical protein